jgi:hypothetical protein
MRTRGDFHEQSPFDERRCHAQGVGGRDAPSAAPAARGGPATSPSADRAAPAERAAPVNRDEATDTSKRPDAGSEMKSTQSDDKVKRDDGATRASETRDNAQKPNAQANDNKSGDAKGSKDMKAEGRPNGDADANKAAANNKPGTTTGQAGAGAKMTSEQRTKITTVIKQQKVQSVTNVNFSVSVGTRVPRDVGFHPLPAEIVTVYPDWRGYDFILVRDQIVVIDPSTYEIVAVIDA